jgi:hypothetical protein
MGKYDIVCMFESNLRNYIYSFRLVQTRPYIRLELVLVLCTVLDVLTFSIFKFVLTSLFLKKCSSWTSPPIIDFLLVMDESFLIKRLVLLNIMTPVNYIDRMGTLDHKWFQTSPERGLFEKKTRPITESWLEKRLVFLLVLCSPRMFQVAHSFSASEHHFDSEKRLPRSQECDECTSEILFSKFSSIREL